MRLAKSAVDVGMMTNDWPSWERELDRLGVVYDHLLKIGGGVHQHRFEAGSSVLKVNSHREPLEIRPSALHSVRLVAETDQPERWATPEGVAIEVVPAGTDGIVDVEVTWRSADPHGVIRFLQEGFGAQDVHGRWKLGTSWFVVESDGPEPDRTDHQLDGAGFRYLTAQVHDVVAEHRRMVELGFTSGREPVRLGDTACISFVLAPDGTWVELSQRASLTGPLPDL